MPTPIILILSLFAVIVGVIAVAYLAVPLFQGLAWLLTTIGRGVVGFVRHVFRFAFGMMGDLVRTVGGVITSIVLVPLIVGNVLIGRWSAATHFGRVLQDEVKGVGHCLYRVAIGHPAKFLLLGGLVEGIEQRIPQAVAQSPGSDKPSGRIGQFEGYSIVGSLPGGGSGGRLYVAEPDERKRAAFARSGREVKQVVIKAFSLSDGSSLPQIIRESRALEAAKRLGLILDHELTDARFFYVMEYIPGDSLTIVTKRLHAESGPQGLAGPQLASAVSMIGDLLGELDRYHRGGLWHKDVKPDNIIINQGRAHLVDLGLVTPLRSAMTLTTHGTEYFRDPELVRMALRGAKVNEVDGVKFDVYGVGAVLYSVIENSFPAHGGLSQITRSCPEALRWIVRRAMTDLHNRYASAGEMLSDLRALLAASDPFMLKPADLPSVRGGAPAPTPAPADDFADAVAGAGAAAAAPAKEGFIFEAQVGWGPPAAGPTPPAAPAGDGNAGGRRRPRLSVTDWWTGRYEPGEPAGPLGGFDARRIGIDAERLARDLSSGVEQAADAVRRSFGGAPIPRRTPGGKRSAAEQIHAAQERVRRAQERVRGRMAPGAFSTSFGRSGRFSTRPNAGVAGAFFTFLAVAVAVPMFLVILSLNKADKEGRRAHDAALAEAGRIAIETDFGRLAVNLDEARSASQIADEFRHTVRAWKEASQGSANAARVGGSDGDIADLNEFGQKVSAFFDHLREAKQRAAGSSVESGAPEPSAADSTPPPPPVPAGSAGSVMLLNLLPADAQEDEAATVARLAARLASRGFAVRGVGSDDGDTELLAAGKRVVELAQPDDPDAAARVQEWIDRPETGLDAVLWIGPGKEPGAVVRRLFVRGGADVSAVAAALATDR
jgi:serine/threonine protein kinase